MLKWVNVLIWQKISIRLNFHLLNLEQGTAGCLSEWALTQYEKREIGPMLSPALSRWEIVCCLGLNLHVLTDYFECLLCACLSFLCPFSENHFKYVWLSLLDVLVLLNFIRFLCHTVVPMRNLIWIFTLIYESVQFPFSSLINTSKNIF